MKAFTCHSFRQNYFHAKWSGRFLLRQPFKYLFRIFIHGVNKGIYLKNFTFGVEFNSAPEPLEMLFPIWPLLTTLAYAQYNRDKSKIQNRAFSFS